MVYSQDQAEPEDGLATPDASDGRRDVLVEQVVNQSRRLGAAMRVRLPANLRTEYAQVTLHQVEILTWLADGGRSMHEVCEEFGIAESAATALADKLVRHGLVERQSDPADRRAVRLCLTERASRLACAYSQLRRQRAKSLLEALDEGQLQALVGIYEVLAARAHRADEEEDC